MNGLTAVSSGSITVGVSVSEPADEELVRLGLGVLHIRHAFIETVRHILAAGWSIAYGGDFRQQGYTEALVDLVRTYDRKELSGPDRVAAYLAWPIWTGLTDRDWAELANVVTTVRVPAAEGAPESLPPFPDRDGSQLLCNSVSLTAMRREMTARVGARVVLGGRVAGQQGLYPGVLEEAVLALDAGVPLFVAGGFGGCARVISDAIHGTWPAELSIEYQRLHTPRYSELVEAAQMAGAGPSYVAICTRIASAGMAGLNNRLNAEENERLFATADVDEVVALVLRGLRRLVGDSSR